MIVVLRISFYLYQPLHLQVSRIHAQIATRKHGEQVCLQGVLSDRHATVIDSVTIKALMLHFKIDRYESDHASFVLADVRREESGKTNSDVSNYWKLMAAFIVSTFLGGSIGVRNSRASRLLSALVSSRSSLHSVVAGVGTFFALSPIFTRVIKFLQLANNDKQLNQQQIDLMLRKRFVESMITISNNQQMILGWIRSSVMKVVDRFIEFSDDMEDINKVMLRIYERESKTRRGLGIDAKPVIDWLNMIEEARNVDQVTWDLYCSMGSNVGAVDKRNIQQFVRSRLKVLVDMADSLSNGGLENIKRELLRAYMKNKCEQLSTTIKFFPLTALNANLLLMFDEAAMRKPCEELTNIIDEYYKEQQRSQLYTGVSSPTTQISSTLFTGASVNNTVVVTSNSDTDKRERQYYVS